MGSLDPTLAETGAVLMAIRLCQMVGLHSVHFEGDAQLVMDGVNSLGKDWSRTGLMLEDIRNELRVFVNGDCLLLVGKVIKRTCSF